MSFKKILLPLLTAACVFAAQPWAKAGAPKVMRVGIGVPETHFEYKAFVKFKEYVQDKTGGGIEVQLFPSTQLGDDKVVLESIKVGSAHMCPAGPAVVANFVKDMSLATLPYLFPTQEAADKVMDGPVGIKLLDTLAKAGYKGLGYGDFGYRNVTNNKRPIATLEDFSGLKIRVMQNPVHLEMFRTLGAQPTAMAFSEVFSALQQGVIDGQENPYKNITSNKLYEVQKYLSNTNHVYEWVVFVVGKKWFDGLTPDEQRILQEGADIIRDSMRADLAKEDEAALKEMLDHGMDYTEITPDEMRRIREKVAPVRDKVGNSINKALYEELIKAIDEASAK